MVVVFATEPNGSVFQPSLNESLGLDASAGLEVDLATFAINFVATTPGADVNHIGWRRVEGGWRYQCFRFDLGGGWNLMRLCS